MALKPFAVQFRVQEFLFHVANLFLLMPYNPAGFKGKSIFSIPEQTPTTDCTYTRSGHETRYGLDAMVLKLVNSRSAINSISICSILRILKSVAIYCPGQCRP
jgi:hypothetical protein